MKHSIKKSGLAGSLMAGAALGLIAVASASSHGAIGRNPGGNAFSGGDAFLYDSSYSSDTLTPYGGNGTGGSGMGSDTSLGGSQGGTGLDSQRLNNPDSNFQQNPDGYPGTGGSGDTGMGGTGNGGTGGSDSLGIPSDSTRSTDSLGVPDWQEQG